MHSITQLFAQIKLQMHQTNNFQEEKILQQPLRPLRQARSLLKVKSRELNNHLQTVHASLVRKSSGPRQLSQLKRLNDTIDTCKVKTSMQGSKGLQIYFNKTKKYNYMKGIIDKYFDDGQTDKTAIKFKQNPEESHHNKSTIIPQISKKETQQKESLSRRRVNAHINRRRLKETSQVPEEPLIESKLLNEQHNDNEMDESLSFSHKNSSSLPPIDQLFEDKEQDTFGARYDSLSNLNDSLFSSFHSQILPLVREQKKVKIMENEVYKVQAVIPEGNKNGFRLKTYTEQGLTILSRQHKATLIGAQSVWKEYRYDSRCLISPPLGSLKQLLFKARQTDIESKFYTLKPKKYYQRLIANQCEELKRVTRQLCKSLIKVESKIINNKINTANLFLGKFQNLYLGEWGFGSFRDSHLIQGIEFQNRLDPILKSQKQWFIPPEYLSPQIVQAVSSNQQLDFAFLGSASDIWSLGVTLFEIVTLIPVWITQKCVVNGKNMTARSGLLAPANRDIKRLLKRQQKLAYLMKKTIQEECGEEIDKAVLEVIYQCVQFEPRDRPSYEEIIQLLK